MGKTTGISWTESSWNPWLGCTKVSAGCDHCYMFREQRQYGNDPELVRRSKTKFTEPLKWKDGRLIFTCSWSDWFHADADPWRDEAWDVIRNCPQHTFQILTKRPGRMVHCLPSDWGDGYPNVWLGVSVESAAFLNRIRVLRDTPAALRFVSAEPLLRSLGPDLDLTGIGWVIVGGESGSRREARPMHPAWVDEILVEVMRSRAYPYGPDVGYMGSPHSPPAFHFKQWGSWSPVLDGSARTGDLFLSEDGTVDENPGIFMRYAGPNPKSGGKLLDGREWCEIPPTRQPVTA